MPVRLDISCDHCFEELEIGNDCYCKTCYESLVGDKSSAVKDWKNLDEQLKTKDINIKELRAELKKLKEE